jgi:hypothetical protein
MKRTILSTLLAFGLAGLATAGAGAEYPPRKPGLWEMKMSQADGKSAPMVSHQCIDAKTDQAMRELGQGAGQSTCSKQDMRKDGDKIVVDSVCKIGGSTATSHMVMTGDFGNAYRMETKSTYSPPLAGRAEGSAIMETKWVGPCKADQKPGDMIMANGMKMNIVDMMSMQQGKKK